MKSARLAFRRGLAALMAAIAILEFGVASGSPGDLFATAAPTSAADAPHAADVKDGDVSIATSTGAAQYSYPISVPPGRLGAQPALSLSYSSQAALFGSNLGAGWTLGGVPRIEEDTSQGRLRTHFGGVEVFQGDARKADDRFVSSLAGGRPLIVVTTDPSAPNVYASYRAQNDTSFARYQRMDDTQPFRWRVLTTEGTTLYFGDTDHAPGCPISDGYAPLTRQVDSFGNEVSYEYVMSSGECMLTRITWGQNAVAALPSFASLEIGYHPATLCYGIPVGSQMSYRTGTRIVTGANVIFDLTATAYEPGNPSAIVHTRKITFGYDAESETCPAAMTHGPIRLLTSIQESAWGTDLPRVDLPPVTFGYGPTVVELTAQTQGVTPWLHGVDEPGGLAWGYRRNDDRWPTVEAMLIDIDGDGRPDRLHNATVDENGETICKATWQRNNRPSVSSFEPAVPITFGDAQSERMPMLRWQGANDGDPNGSPLADPNAPQLEGCALNGQVTAFHNSHPTANRCHDGEDCTLDHYCDDGNVCPDGFEPNPRTYLAYRWMDMDGDQLPDLVAAVHGSANRYDILRGNDLVDGQQVGYEPPLFGTVPVPGGFPPCSDLPDTCKQLSSNCVSRTDRSNCTSSAACEVAWDGINACLAQAPDQECQLDLAVVPLIANDNQTPSPSQMVSQRQPYRMCNNLYPWFIFKNRGNGNFADTPVIKYQPIPLESDTGDSSLFGGVAATNHGVIDMDGDGLVDGVVRARDYDNIHPWWWWVWPNDGTGQLGPRRYFWVSRERPRAAINGTSGEPPDVVVASMGLFDMNGDGLPDHWHVHDYPDPAANVAYNKGTGFEVYGPFPPQDGLFDTNTTKPATEGQVYDPVLDQDPSGNPHLLGGKRYAALHPFDADGDGRPDMVRKDGELSNPYVVFNVGGQFSGAPFMSYPHEGAAQRMAAGPVDEQDPTNTWELDSDMVDLDGDGLAESASWDKATHQFTHQSYEESSPPRLLLTVDNGRGATTSIAYASMHDDAVVTQHADEVWAPGRPKASPKSQWVVKSMTVHDAFANTTSTTSYEYVDPRFGPDDEGRFAFRGFEQVTTTAQSGMQTVQRYRFDPDWSGRLAETLVVPAEAPTEVRSIDRTTWEARTLSGTWLVTYHPTVTEHFTCANGQDEATCLASAAGYTRTESTLQELPLTGNKLLWEETASTLQAQVGDADGDRQTVHTFELLADAVTYRVRPRTTTRYQRVNGSQVLFAKSDQTWSSDLARKLTDEVWFDDVDANRAITRYVYDEKTGNVIERWKPEQNAAGTTRTVYTFDSRKLFVANETNEKGHPFDYTWEYGTGTKLTTVGPNTRTCTTQPTCLSGELYPVRETKLDKLDGLGRVLEHWETTGDTGSFYTLRLFSRTSYVDTAVVPTAPTSVFIETALDHTGTVFRQERRELDGLGRPLRTTVLAQGSAAADQLTAYGFRDDGTLAGIGVPDPTANDASMVVYLYGFDSLGRPTYVRRPDHEGPLDQQSGVDISYDGLTKTVTEFVGPDGGQPASTRTISDAFGRLVEVHERTALGPETWAVTHYSYDPHDIVRSVVDPEGVTTTMVHDFAGRRTEITRHGRTWRYGYDRNGNIVSEQFPGSPNPPVTDADYTTTTVYDDLDRPLSRLVAPRGLSEPDRVLFGSDTETFTWDAGANHIGYLTLWLAYGPGAVTPTIRLNVLNDNQGHRTKTLETLRLDDLPALTRQVLDFYHPNGQLKRTVYYDNVGGSERTESYRYYDLRGLPSKITLLRTGSPGTLVDAARYERNVAGLVTRRYANTIGSPMTSIEDLWTYDKLGRVTSQIVQTNPGQVPVVSQALTYFGNDDPATLTHRLGTTARDFQFGYDLRHQLTSANATTQGYFTSSYSHGPAGRFTAVDVAQTDPAPGSEVKNRSVTYAYDDPDPERVTALIDTATQDPYATYQYDDAGNQISRCYGAVPSPCTGESVDFVYDGHNQLRRATKRLSGVLQGSEEYWYDNAGQRIAILRRDASGAKTELVWFIGDVEAHYDGAGAVTHSYSHISQGTPVARVDRSSDLDAPVEFQFHGLVQNTVSAVAYDGTVNASFSYSPFGEVIEAIDGGAQQSSATHNRRFNNKYTDAVSDLSYYGFRYSDRTSLTWTQSDPAFRFAPDAAWAEPRKALLYTNDLNNPLRYLDPDGRCSLIAGIGGVCAASDAAGQTESNAQTVLSGLDVLDGATNPERYGSRAADEARAAEDASSRGDVGGVYSHGTAALNNLVGGITVAAVELGLLGGLTTARDPAIGAAAAEAPAADAVAPHEITISKGRFPESAQHIEDAQAAGKPSTLTIDRAGAATRRRASLRGTKTKPGLDRDEYPPAMTEEGGRGASVRHISPSDNRGAGACIGAQCRGLPDGTKVKIRVVE